MSVDYNRPGAGFTKPSATTKIPDHTLDNTDGVDAAITHYDATADPQDAAWGAPEQGQLFHDRGAASGASTTNPLFAKWEDLTGAASYGWRYLCLRYWKFLSTEVALTLTAAQEVTGQMVDRGFEFAQIDPIWKGADVAEVQGAIPAGPVVKREAIRVAETIGEDLIETIFRFGKDAGL